APTQVPATAAATPATVASPTTATAASTAPATATPFVPPKRPTAAPGQKVVTFWYHWGSGQVIGQGMEAVSRAFEKVNPSVKVNSLSLGDNSIAKVLTAVAAGEPPDTFDDYRVQSMAIRGATSPLDDFVKSSKTVKKENYYDAI